MTIGDIIRDYRKEHKLSQRQFAIKSNVSNGYISMLEKGKNPSTNEPIMPSMLLLGSIANAMELTLNELLCLVDDMPKNIQTDFSAFPNIFPITTKKIPLLGEIACGKPIFADEDRESYMVSGTNMQADFCLKCKGDSMINARILDGDIVFIKSQPMVENGEIAAVIINDEATLKRVSYFPEKNMIVLKPENPKYSDFIFTDEELNSIRILGKAIAFQSDVK